MDKRITRYSSLQAMKADEYRFWQRLPGSERIRAVMDLNLNFFRMGTPPVMVDIMPKISGEFGQYTLVLQRHRSWIC